MDEWTSIAASMSLHPHQLQEATKSKHFGSRSGILQTVAWMCGQALRPAWVYTHASFRKPLIHMLWLKVRRFANTCVDVWTSTAASMSLHPHQLQEATNPYSLAQEAAYSECLHGCVDRHCGQHEFTPTSASGRQYPIHSCSSSGTLQTLAWKC